MGPKTQKKCAWAEMYQNDGLPWIYPALARRHTDGPLRAALLKTTVRCEGCRADAPLPCFKSSYCSWVLKLGPWYLVPILVPVQYRLSRCLE